MGSLRTAEPLLKPAASSQHLPQHGQQRPQPIPAELPSLSSTAQHPPVNQSCGLLGDKGPPHSPSRCPALTPTQLGLLATNHRN